MTFKIRNPHSAIRNAFTLVEILIVIAIIILLTAIGMGVGFKIYNAARVEQTKTRLTLAMNAVKDYYDKNGKFPDQVDDDEYYMIVPHLDSNDEVLLSYEQFISKLKDLDAAAIEVEFEPNDSNPEYAIFRLMDALGHEIRYVRDGGIGGTPLLVSPGLDGNYRMDGSDDAEKEAWGKDDIRSDK